jgi:hypothetical protein
VAAVDVQLRDHDEFLQQIWERLLLSQDAMKAQSNSKHRALEFAIGEWVWLRLHHWSAAALHQLNLQSYHPVFMGCTKSLNALAM